MQRSYHNSLSNLAYENIAGSYWRGKWGNYDIILREGDCFINASYLCERFGKSLDYWRSQNMGLIVAVNYEMSKINPDKCESIQEVYDNYLYSGTYVHPYLFPHLFSYLSNSSAILMAQIVNQYYNNTFIENSKCARGKCQTCWSEL